MPSNPVTTEKLDNVAMNLMRMRSKLKSTAEQINKLHNDSVVLNSQKADLTRQITASNALLSCNGAADGDGNGILSTQPLSTEDEENRRKIQALISSTSRTLETTKTRLDLELKLYNYSRAPASTSDFRLNKINEHLPLQKSPVSANSSDTGVSAADKKMALFTTIKSGYDSARSLLAKIDDIACQLEARSQM